MKLIDFDFLRASARQCELSLIAKVKSIVCTIIRKSTRSTSVSNATGTGFRRVHRNWGFFAVG